MPEPQLSELERLMAEPSTAPQAAPGLLDLIGSGISNVASFIGSGTQGAFLGLLDLLDRPGRAVRHLIAGNPEQAAEAFDPFNLLTPNIPSEPISMSENLAQRGVEEGPSLGIGSTRAVGGFVLDLLTDPLTYFGAPLGRSFTKYLAKPAGRTFAKGVSALAEREVPILSGLARGTSAVGQAFGDAFIKDFKVRRGLGQTAIPEVADAYLQRREGWLRQLGSQKSQYDALGAKIEQGMTEAESIRLQDLRSIPGATEEFLAQEGAQNIRPLQTDITQIPGMWAKLGLPETATGEEMRATLKRTVADLDPKLKDRWRLALTGDPAFANQIAPARGVHGVGGNIEDIRNTIPSSRLDLSDVPDLVKYDDLGMRERMFMLDHLQPAKVEDLMKRAGSEYVGHYASKAQVAEEFLRLLKKEVPGLTDGMDPTAILQRAREVIKPTRIAAGTLGVRRIMGSLKEIEEQIGPLFERRIGPEIAQTGKRYAAVETVDGLMRETLTDPNLARVLPAGSDVPLPEGFVRVAMHEFPRSIQNRLKAQGTTDIAMHAAVKDDLFGRGGFLHRVEQFKEAGGLLGLLQNINRYYKPWTLAHPATITRDAIGDLALNQMAGVSPRWYGLGREVQSAWYARQAGKPIHNPTKMIAGKTVQEWVEKLTDAVIPGHALAHTEFYGQQFNALQGGTLRRIFRADPGQNTFTRATMQARGYVSDASRIAHFMAKHAPESAGGWGLSMEDALLSVKKNLYDVDQLTNFERGVMREVFPFYPWARQNLPNMIQKTIEGSPLTKSGLGPNFPLVMGRTKINLDHEGRADVPDEILPEWLQGQVTLPVGRKNGVLSVFALDGWLPVADVQQIDSVEKFVKFAFNSAQPLLSTPLELAFNFDGFFKRAIEKYDGQTEHFLGMPLSRKSAALLRNVRLLNELDRTLLPMIDKLTGSRITTGTERLQDLLRQTEWTELALRAGAGIKIRPIDLQRAKQTGIKRTEREIAELETARRYARRDKDTANVKVTTRRIAEKRALLETMRGVDPERNVYLGSLLEPDLH